MPDDSDDSGYDLAPQSPQLRPAKATITPPPKQTASATLNYRAPKSDAPSIAEPEVLKNYYMPLWLLIGGGAIEIIAQLFSGPSHLIGALAYVGLELALGTATMLLGILLAAKIRQIDLGNFWTAVFKLSAISVAPAAALDLATPLLRIIPFGFLLGLGGEFLFYFALLGALFDLEESDTWYCIMVIFLFRLGFYFTWMFTLGRS